MPGSPGLPEFRPPRLDGEPPTPRAGEPPPEAEPPAGGTAQEWRKLARRLDKLAAELEALTAGLPAGEPDPQQAKAMRSAAGRISQHAGTLKRRLGIGGK